LEQTPGIYALLLVLCFAMADQSKAAEEIFRQHGGILRMSAALEAGISRRTLYGMHANGTLERLSRGVYRLTSLPGLEVPDLITVATRIPNGVVCLISALAVHELVTQVPHAVDIAIARGAEKPRIDYPPVNVYWFSGKAFTSGIETRPVDGARVRVYGPEKSIADAFKYRNKLGLDLALEALRTWRARRHPSMETLLEYSRICRVERVVRPYLEAIS
jgi:predicted transcriptional regulator of viral defense system